MSDPTKSPDPHNPTADWRKYPKGPNFLGIVLGSSAVLVVLLIVAWFLLRSDGTKMIPHGPNPQPNSMVAPSPLGGGTATRIC